MEQLRFDSEVYGQAQPWVVYHRGLEYKGEVIVAEEVDLTWGQPLGDQLSFRIVFLTTVRRFANYSIDDRRVAIAVPSRPPQDVYQSASREIRSVRETIAKYTTSHDSDELAIRKSMREREMSLQSELGRRFKVAYSGGRVYTYGKIRARSSEDFAGDNLESWANSLAYSVLSSAHSELPIAFDEFPGILTEDTIHALFRGLFQEEREVADVVEAYGPGLGLTRKESPHAFHVVDCAVVDKIRDGLHSGGGEVSAQDILRLLSVEDGITYPLSLLYLLAFVRHERVELELTSEHHLMSRTGGRFSADRITWDLIPEMDFPSLAHTELGTLRLQPSVAWDTVLPYATLLIDELHSSSDPTDIASQNSRLLGVLSEITQDLQGISEAVSELEAGLRI